MLQIPVGTKLVQCPLCQTVTRRETPKPRPSVQCPGCTSIVQVPAGGGDVFKCGTCDQVMRMQDPNAPRDAPRQTTQATQEQPSRQQFEQAAAARASEVRTDGGGGSYLPPGTEGSRGGRGGLDTVDEFKAASAVDTAKPAGGVMYTLRGLGTRIRSWSAGKGGAGEAPAQGQGGQQGPGGQGGQRGQGGQQGQGYDDADIGARVEAAASAAADEHAADLAGIPDSMLGEDQKGFIMSLPPELRAGALEQMMEAAMAESQAMLEEVPMIEEQLDNTAIIGELQGQLDELDAAIETAVIEEDFDAADELETQAAAIRANLAALP